MSPAIHEGESPCEDCGAFDGQPHDERCPIAEAECAAYWRDFYDEQAIDERQEEGFR